jgi:hypothetical protein
MSLRSFVLNLGTTPVHIATGAIVRYVRFFGGNIWPARVGGGYPHTTRINGFPGGSTSESRFMSARGDLYFAGHNGGQGLQQSRAGVGAAARTGCFAA